MYKSFKEITKSPSYYLSLAQQLQPNKHKTSSQFHLSIHPPPTSHNQQIYTFNKDFCPKYNKSTLPKNSYNPKYRSASLPSQCLVRNPLKNHFSYYEQLKKRQYIVAKNYQSMSQLKTHYLLGRKRSYDNFDRRDFNSSGRKDTLNNNHPLSVAYNTELNRFSKYDPGDKKLSKSTLVSKAPLIKTNIKLYQKPDKHDRITQIHSNFESFPPHQYNGDYPKYRPNQYQKERPGQTPIMDCNIQVRSDEEGRYYSTVQSQFPTVLSKHNAYHDHKNNVFTTEAVLLREYPNSYLHNQPLNCIQPHQPIHSHNNTQNYPNYISHVDKDSQTENKHKPKQYDTYIVRKKTSPIKVQQKYLSSKPQYNHCLQSMQTKPSLNQQIPKTSSPIKRKIIIEYQMNSPKKQKSPTKQYSKRKSVPKTHAQNLGLKYYYSKYYMAEQQNRQRNNNRSKSGSIRNHEKSETKQKTKRSPSKNTTQQKSTKRLISAHELKTKQKTARPCLTNYASTHLFTTKK